jgi:chemotaxis protein MotB
VTRFLISSGLASQAVSAAGYGEYDPVLPNVSAENRAKNRRIEITLVPSIDELIDVPDDR